MHYFVKDKDINYIFWDIGVTSNYNQNWSKSSSLTINRTNTGTECTPSANWTSLSIPTDYYSIEYLPFCIEFDVVSVTNTVRWYIYYIQSNNSQFIILATGHYKINIDTSGITVIKNNGTPQSLNYTTLNNLSFSFVDTTSRLTFKEFMIYSL